MVSLDALIPELVEAAKQFVQILGAAGVQPRVTSTLRTYREQTKLYRRFLAGHSAYPAAPPGSSAHEFGYAFDVVVTGIGNQDDAGALWESWGGIWGAARDPIHFEHPAWRSAGHSAAYRGTRPSTGTFVYQLADFLSGFVPYLGAAQLVDQIYRLFGDADAETNAEWYLQHPAEAIRDIVGALASTAALASQPPPSYTVSAGLPGLQNVLTLTPGELERYGIKQGTISPE